MTGRPGLRQQTLKVTSYQPAEREQPYRSEDRRCLATAAKARTQQSPPGSRAASADVEPGLVAESCGPQGSCRHRMPILCSGEAAVVSKSSSSGHGSPGRAVRGAELATEESPKALFDAAVAELRAREC
jgi:hypothetical protein